MPVKPNYIPKILIVDDEPFNLEFLEIILRQYGYRTVVANNGRDGRLLAEREKPDLVLLDIMMTGESGFECAAALRLSPETCEIPIIFLTALDDPKSNTRGFDLGAVDFIVKPFEYRDVLQRIKIHLQIMAADKRLLTRTPLPPEQETATEVPGTGYESVFPVSPPESDSFIHESVLLRDISEAHLIINMTPPVHAPQLRRTLRMLLSGNTGPLYSPSTTMRNIGITLRQMLGADHNISGTFAEIDRENRMLTVVNAGSPPCIFLRKSDTPMLIERQSTDMGSLGLGLPPCSSYEMARGDRIFIFSKNMLDAFESVGEAINELKEACELSAGVDVETACHAAGEMLQKGGFPLDGILLAVEG
ncbi:response regulator [Maridesulfovibrio sp. FT414]|uniref:response regulator n=1 Tax=Maridesulfovibrio sp. FT414 TaxID=2979469 RepID=UPI003D80735D